jgi:dissimilatory sulfite reductase (desulfoviridin) alpha/beta subunit
MDKMESLFETFKETIRAVLNRIIEVWRKIVDHTQEMFKDYMKRERLQRFDASIWRFNQERLQHMAVTKVKAQEYKMRSYVQPWKAWKAQRR